MSGLPEDNFPAFNEAAERLTAAGYVVINPAQGSTPGSNSRANQAWYETEEYRSRIANCLEKLRTAEGLAQLPGWGRSNGAREEHFRSTLMGIPNDSVDDWIANNRAKCIRWVGPPECMPTQSYPGDAGFDLVVYGQTRIAIDGVADVPLGIKVELPPGVWAMLMGRSSTMRERGLHVAQAIIDQGYRGPLFAACHNISDRVVWLEPGERVAQLIPMPLMSERLGVRHVEVLGSSERGEAAFGSSGGFADGRGGGIRVGANSSRS